MKKIIPFIVLIVILCGSTAFMGYKWHATSVSKENDVAMLNGQISALNATLASQETCVEGWQLKTKKASGSIIKDTDLVVVPVTKTSCSNATIYNKDDIVGKMVKVDLSAGTTITTDMICDASSDEKDFAYPIDITLNYLPVLLYEGDYININIYLPNGEKYGVITHRQVKLINNNTITIYVTEEESYLWLSALWDVGNYTSSGCYIAVEKYLTPGNYAAVPFYCVNRDMENNIIFNPNIKDPTRCINSSLRDHIDEVLFLTGTSDNAAVGSAYLSTVVAQGSQGGAARTFYIEKNTNEDGVFIKPETPSTGDTPTEGESSSIVGDNFDASELTNNATEKLEDALSGLDELGGF